MSLSSSPNSSNVSSNFGSIMVSPMSSPGLPAEQFRALKGRQEIEKAYKKRASQLTNHSHSDTVNTNTTTPTTPAFDPHDPHEYHKRCTKKYELTKEQEAKRAAVRWATRLALHDTSEFPREIAEYKPNTTGPIPQRHIGGFHRRWNEDDREDDHLGTAYTQSFWENHPAQGVHQPLFQNAKEVHNMASYVSDYGKRPSLSPFEGRRRRTLEGCGPERATSMDSGRSVRRSSATSRNNQNQTFHGVSEQKHAAEKTHFFLNSAYPDLQQHPLRSKFSWSTTATKHDPESSKSKRRPSIFASLIKSSDSKKQPSMPKNASLFSNPQLPSSQRTRLRRKSSVTGSRRLSFRSIGRRGKSSDSDSEESQGSTTGTFKEKLGFGKKE